MIFIFACFLDFKMLLEILVGLLFHNSFRHQIIMYTSMSQITALARAKGTSIIFHPHTLFFIFTITKSTTNIAANITNFAKSHILISLYLTINHSHIFVFEVKTFHGYQIISYLIDDTSYSALIGDTLFYLNIKLFKTFFNFLSFFQDIQSRFYGDWRRCIHPFNGFL